jgi:4-amino-4-deoxy-L-arabinose transferase-like glycosyltransferase
LYLPLVTFVSYHLTETLATALLTAVLLLVVEVRTASASRIPICGLLLSALVLVRPNCCLLISLPFAVLYWRSVAQRERALWKSIALLLSFVLPLGVWVGRNSLISQEFVGLTTQFGTAFYHSSLQYTEEASYAETGPGWEATKLTIREKATEVHRNVRNARVPGVTESVQFDVALNRELKSAAVALFRRTGVPPFRNLVLRLLYMWSPNDYFSGWVHAIARLEHGLFAASVIIGIWLLRTERRLYVLLLPAVYFTVLSLVFGAEGGRYSIPARPGLMPVAAYAWFYVITVRYKQFDRLSNRRDGVFAAGAPPDRAVCRKAASRPGRGSSSSNDCTL